MVWKWAGMRLQRLCQKETIKFLLQWGKKWSNPHLTVLTLLTSLSVKVSALCSCWVSGLPFVLSPTQILVLAVSSCWNRVCLYCGRVLVWSLGVSLLIKYPPCTNGTLYYFSASMCLCLKCSGRLHYMRIWPSSLRNFAFMPEEKQPSVMTSPCAALPMSDDDRKKKTAFTAPTFPPSPGMV